MHQQSLKEIPHAAVLSVWLMPFSVKIKVVVIALRGNHDMHTVGYNVKENCLCGASPPSARGPPQTITKENSFYFCIIKWASLIPLSSNS